MNGFGVLFSLATVGLLFCLPRRWAPLPFLLAATTISFAQRIEVGPFSFTLIRLLIVFGMIRVLVNRERITGQWGTMDRLMICWALWAVFALAFHKPSEFIFRLGGIYDACGIYFLFRIFISGLDDIRHVFKMICVLLVPMALFMVVERWAALNPLSLVGFAPENVVVREGYVRARSAFGHPILAGSVGMACLPMALYLWRENRRFSLVGLAASTMVMYTSGSSGPILAAMASLGALALWKFRAYMRIIRWLAVFLIIALQIVMNDPVYFLMARIDITGGSQSYFRAQLIRSAIEHLDEWWLAGTDYTRHWMMSGIPANQNHTDMTNYFLQMGVWGGFPMMVLFAAVLIAAFMNVGRAVQRMDFTSHERPFLIWTLGAMLFGHCVNFMSIGYFDQTVVFYYLILAAIGVLPFLQPSTSEEFQSETTQSENETALMHGTGYR